MCCEEVLGPVDVERCQLHEDQAQDTLRQTNCRRPPHRQKCARTANYFIGRHPGTVYCPSRHPSTPVWSGTAHEEIGAAKWDFLRSSLAMNPKFNISSDENSVSCGDPLMNVSIPPFAFTTTHHAPIAFVMVWGVAGSQYTVTSVDL
ncbi:hypothetical protein TNCV_4424861 [Trichonephila clavipes]|nr:hypothetical protein TNCV_4424861 [Trichonephila clavipes]